MLMKEENKEVINMTERADISEQGAESKMSTGKKYVRPYCGAEFTRSIDLTRHVKYKHPKHAGKKSKGTHKAQPTGTRGWGVFLIRTIETFCIFVFRIFKYFWILFDAAVLGMWGSEPERMLRAEMWGVHFLFPPKATR